MLNITITELKKIKKNRENTSKILKMESRNSSRHAYYRDKQTATSAYKYFLLDGFLTYFYWLKKIMIEEWPKQFGNLSQLIET